MVEGLGAGVRLMRSGDTEWIRKKFHLVPILSQIRIMVTNPTLLVKRPRFLQFLWVIAHSLIVVRDVPASGQGASLLERFPCFRQPLFLKGGARGGTRTPKPFGTGSLILRVYQFRHSRVGNARAWSMSGGRKDATGVLCFLKTYRERWRN